jgi:hypothetical protein
MERLTNLFIALFIYPFILAGIWLLIIAVAIFGPPPEESL